jgi:cytochrome c5
MRIVGELRRYQHRIDEGDSMRSSIAILITASALAACAGRGETVDNEGADLVVNGEAAYVENCASCHDEGLFGAPRVGAPQDWQSRSNLWQAVLMEHAKEGFFEMPARGGSSELTDDMVFAATEYMLENTFADRPKD